MKPIRLELKEFGPYKNEIIEWDRIINEPIFLITGAYLESLVRQGQESLLYWML